MLKEQLKAMLNENYDEESKVEIRRWLSELELHKDWEQLLSHKVVQDFKDNLISKIVAFNSRLYSDRNLEGLERLNLMDRRDLYQLVINLLKVGSKEEEIKHNLENYAER